MVAVLHNTHCIKSIVGGCVPASSNLGVSVPSAKSVFLMVSIVY